MTIRTDSLTADPRGPRVVALGGGHGLAASLAAARHVTDSLTAVVTDIARSLERQGIRRLLIVNGHGGNYVLGNAVQEAGLRGRRLALFPGEADWAAARAAAGLDSAAVTDMHAGELETILPCT